MTGHPPPIRLSPRDAELVALYAENLLSIEQAAELNARLHASPELLSVIAEFAVIEEHLRLLLEEKHAVLDEDWLVLLSELEKASEFAALVDRTEEICAAPDRARHKHGAWERPTEPRRYDIVIPKPGLYAAIAALVVIAALLLWPEFRPDTTRLPAGGPGLASKTEPADSRPARVGVLTYEVDTRWGGPGHEPRTGMPVYDEPLVLLEGYALIRLDSGAELTLEAPCHVDLISANKVYLKSGRIAGLCPTQSSTGFVVQTPNTVITDLGTEFGVAVSSDSDEHAFVFNGSIRMEAAGGAPSAAMVLRQNESGRFSRESLGISQDKARGNDFVRGAALTNRPRIDGGAKLLYAPPVSVKPSALKSDEAAVFLEHAGLTIPPGFTVNAVLPGLYFEHDMAVELIERDPLTIDCYFVHFEPTYSPTAISFELQFDSEIVGVITSGQRLGQTNNLLGSPYCRYTEAGNKDNGLESTGEDVIEITPDRRTLKVRLFVAGHLEQFRVLVRSPAPVDTD